MYIDSSYMEFWNLLVCIGGRPFTGIQTFSLVFAGKKERERDLSMTFVVMQLCISILILEWLLRGSALADGQMPVKELKVPNGDVTLHVRISGNPESENTLVIVNGGPGISSKHVLDLERLADAQLAVVTYDQRGTGQSTTPTDGYELLNHVSDLETVRKSTNARGVHVMGISWGGVIAMRYSTVYPEQVRSIILVGSAPPNWEALSASIKAINQRIAKLQEEGTIPEDLTESPGLALRAYFSDPEFEISKVLESLEINETTQQLVLSAIDGYDCTAEVTTLDHRVLMLWGEDEPFPDLMAETTRDALSNAEVEFVEIKQCGHFYWLERPEEFFSHVRTFLNMH